MKKRVGGSSGANSCKMTSPTVSTGWLNKAPQTQIVTAIFGASYGGYAALMAAVLTPDKFQCAVSYAGVTNLFDIIASDDEDSYWVRAIGDRFDNDDNASRKFLLF